jgi:hypothetical protein
MKTPQPKKRPWWASPFMLLWFVAFSAIAATYVVVGSVYLSLRKLFVDEPPGKSKAPK